MGVVTPTFAPDFIEFLNDKAIALLEYCNTPRSRTEIRLLLQLRDMKHVRERYIYPLLSAKLLVLTDPEHPLSHNQKFKTTKIGIEPIEIYGNIINQIKSPSLFDSLK